MTAPLLDAAGRFVDDAAREVVGEFRRAAAAHAPRVAAPDDRAAFRRLLGARLRDFARTFGFAVDVPGTHPGGISNQELFDLLVARGWAYDAATKRLRDYVRIALLDEFDGATHVPLRFEVEHVVAGATLEWVARRLDRAVSDIDRPPLSPAYAKRKRKRFGTGRAGSASGALADAIRARGRIVLT